MPKWSWGRPRIAQRSHKNQKMIVTMSISIRVDHGFLVSSIALSKDCLMNKVSEEKESLLTSIIHSEGCEGAFCTTLWNDTVATAEV